MKYLVGLTFLLLVISCTDSALFDEQSPTATETLNGSYSQLIIVGDFLYGLNDELLSTVDIRDKENPVVIDVQELDFDIESIFHHNAVLYIGSASRMYIFTINEQGIPEQQSTSDYGLIQDDIICFSDPIVAHGDYAYVTLKQRISEGWCFREQALNQLRIYNVKDVQNPILISITEMARPQGLGVSGDLLFVCDDFNGLVVFDVSDVRAPERIAHFTGYTAHDVIVKPSEVIVVSMDALYQYDYSDRDNITLLSRIDL